MYVNLFLKNNYIVKKKIMLKMENYLDKCLKK